MAEYNITPKTSDTFSISSSTRLAVYNILRELNVPKDIVKNFEVDLLVKHYFQQNSIFIRDFDGGKEEKFHEEKAITEQTILVDKESFEFGKIEDTQISSVQSKAALIIETLNKLDERLTSLENNICLLLSNNSEAFNFMAVEEPTYMETRKKDKYCERVVCAKAAARDAKIEEKKLRRKSQPKPNTCIEDSKVLNMHQNQIDYDVMRRKSKPKPNTYIEDPSVLAMHQNQIDYNRMRRKSQPKPYTCIEDSKVINMHQNQIDSQPKPNTCIEDPEILAMYQNQIDCNLMGTNMSATSILLNLRTAFTSAVPLATVDSVEQYSDEWTDIDE